MDHEIFVPFSACLLDKNEIFSQLCGCNLIFFISLQRINCPNQVHAICGKHEPNENILIVLQIKLATDNCKLEAPANE